MSFSTGFFNNFGTVENENVCRIEVCLNCFPRICTARNLLVAIAIVDGVDLLC